MPLERSNLNLSDSDYEEDVDIDDLYDDGESRKRPGRGKGKEVPKNREMGLDGKDVRGPSTHGVLTNLMDIPT